MGKKSILKGIDKRYAWSFFGVIVSLVGIFIAALTSRERRAAVTFSLLSEVNVLDIHTPVAALDVLYDGTSLQRNGLDLKIATIRVENSGDVHILQSDYDTELQWGLHVIGGRAVSARLTSSSSTYLRQRLVPKVVSGDEVTLSKVILDRGSFATLEILVLHQKDKTPILVPFGKIAGIGSLTMTPAPPTQGNFWMETIGGSLATQITRFVFYTLLCPLLLAISMALALLGAEALQPHGARARRIRLKKILELVVIDDRSRSIISGLYVRGDVVGLRRFEELLNNQAALTDVLETMPDELARSEKQHALRAQAKSKSGRSVELTHRQALFVMENLGFLRRTSNGKVVDIDSRFRSELAVVEDRLAVMV